jgi:hypothetical protein
MNRRDLIKQSALAGATLALGSGEGVAETLMPLQADTSSSDRSLAPKTLDWTERARLGINALTRCLDTSERYTMFCQMRYTAAPPYLLHLCLGDFITCNPKWAESLVMLRLMSGSKQNLDIDEKIMDAMVELIDPQDGLFYLPAEDMQKHRWLSRGDYPIAKEPVTHAFGNARMILAMDAWYQRDHDQVWLDRMHRMATGLGKIAIHKEDYAFYPLGGVGMEFAYLKYSGYKDSNEPYGEHEGAEGSTLNYQGHQIRALSQWYLRSGDKNALDLAGALSRFVMKPKLWGAQQDSKWITGTEHAHYDGHQHGTSLALRGLLAYGHAANDQDVIQFVRDGYHYARSRGIGRIGCFGDYAWRVPTETCSIADMIALAIKLSDYGAGDFWDDVDGYARNRLAEIQLLDAERIKALGRAAVEQPEAYKAFETPRNPNVPWSPPMWDWLLKLQDPFTDDVIDRILGQMFGFSNPNTIAYPSTTGCCSGNGTQALYYVWESTVRYRDGDATVNLLFNRSSLWLDIDSYLPYEGKVIIRNKQARSLSVRIPGWVDKRAVRASIDGRVVRPLWVGNYLVFNSMTGRDIVVINFPLTQETVTYTMPFDKEYTLKLKGGTVIDISPRDESPVGYALYLRDDYQKEVAPLQRRSSYVPDTVIEWA